MIRTACLFFILSVIITSCNSEQADSQNHSAKDENPISEDGSLFRLLSVKESGLDFQNNMTETNDYNYFSFQYAYNGAGVGIGDLNNDGLQDIYLVGNQVQDRLYINKGDLKFEDITQSAGIKDKGGFHFGVTMVDIDLDNDLDIYVSVSGHPTLGKGRSNLLYINNGDLTFTESAAKWGLNETGHSIQSAFFDYDQDGDLDVYITNHPTDFGQNLKERLDKMKNPEEREKDKLYRNNGNDSYSDVTTEAGLVNYGHGLGIVIWDINEDGRDDIYVANDYQSSDFVYVNNGDGTFTNRLKEYFPHIPYYSMGVDIADLNNDGLMDINVVEMLPENYTRRQLNLSNLSERNYYIFNKVGFHHQYLRNCLSINTGQGIFSDRALMTGTEATDWSWATLIADFDNDGLQDILTCNGYLRDMQNKEYIRRLGKLRATGGKLTQAKFDEIAVSTKIRNYLFKNKGGLQFENIASKEGLGHKSFSTGASYADLDNDGDLDLVIANVNRQLKPDPVFLYENQSTATDNFLSIEFEGPKLNTQGEGCRVIAEQGGESFIRELRSTRGYLSSVPPIIYLGLQSTDPLDQLTIIWPDGKFEVKNDVQTGGKMTALYSNASGVYIAPTKESLFKVANLPGLDFVHDDKVLNEFDSEKQLPFRLGMQGPGACIGDVNGDGKDDIFFTATHGLPDKMYVQTGSGFREMTGPWEQFSYEEHICAAFSDIDLDGDLDLLVGSGGIEKGVIHEDYLDKLFINNGKGNFTYRDDLLPRMLSSTSCIKFGDMDGDGDEDVFVGSRSIPGNYGAPPASFLLRNDAGKFTSIALDNNHPIRSLGMVSDATWYDADGDDDLDLIVVGEWSSPSLFINQDGTLINDPENTIPTMTGIWRSVHAADLDGDGLAELILGNAGLNTKYKVSPDAPLRMYCGDLDKNGKGDIAIAYKQGKYYHLDRSLKYLKEQFPSFEKKFRNHSDFVGKSIEQIFGDGLETARISEAGVFESLVLKASTSGYKATILPSLAQVSYTNTIISVDVDDDGDLDLILAGNELYTPIQTGSSDASIGCVLINDGNGEFNALSTQKAGLRLTGWVKGLGMMDIEGVQTLVGWRNNTTPLAYILR